MLDYNMITNITLQLLGDKVVNFFQPNTNKHKKLL